MEYFGTSLTEHGHYRWNLDYEHITENSLRINDLPFHPEQLTNKLPKGEVVFYQGGGYTVIGISGSCRDTRGGTKSIFWVDEIVSKDTIITMIKMNKHASKIIDAMPFTIQWDEDNNQKDNQTNN